MSKGNRGSRLGTRGVCPCHGSTGHPPGFIPAYSEKKETKNGMRKGKPYPRTFRKGP